MTKKAPGTVLVKWVRSGIAFPRRQKEMVRSLGLRRLNEVVRRPDTPHVRGLVARIPHLVEAVEETPVPAWTRVAEYRISAPQQAPAALPQPEEAEPSVESAAPVAVEPGAVPAEVTKRPRAKRSKGTEQEAEESAPAKKAARRRPAEKK